MAVFNGHLTWSCLLCLLGIKAADAKELKLIASQPSLKHVFNVANFDGIVDIQNEIILQVCSGVDEQLGELVSGEEGEILYINAFIGINLFLCMFKGTSPTSFALFLKFDPLQVWKTCFSFVHLNTGGQNM